MIASTDPTPHGIQPMMAVTRLAIAKPLVDGPGGWP
jgi:hypothetical protein